MMRALFATLAITAVTAAVPTPTVAYEDAAVANLSNVCVHNCDKCATTMKGPWYNNDASGTTCTNRTAKEPAFLAVSYNCKYHDIHIRDPQSCKKLLENSRQHMLLGKVYTTFNASAGCRLNAAEGTMFGLAFFQSEACFGLFHPRFAMTTQAAAVVSGLFLGLVSMGCSRKKVHGFVDNMADAEAHRQDFWPGAKTVAMRTIVDSKRQNYLLFFRFNQVIANVWLPMALMWVVSPLIVLPWWFVLYWLPPLFAAGLELFTSPQHLVTPAGCSFLGLHSDHRHVHHELLWSALRPIFLLLGVCGVATIIVHICRMHGLDDVATGAYVMNPVGYWRAGMENQLGNIVLYFTVGATIVCTLLHTILTLVPVARTWLTSNRSGFVSTDRNPELRNEIHDLTEKICVAAAADDEDDQDRVADLNVSTMSRFSVGVALALAIIDFLAYIYKVYAFLKDGRYGLAAVMTFALTESLTTLVLGGHLQEIVKSSKTVAVTGVPSVHFLACCQWDDGLAGIPCLWCTVYGLPLLAITSPVKVATSIFFLITGTRALANYLGDVADSDMWGTTGKDEEREGLLSDEDNDFDDADLE